MKRRILFIVLLYPIATFALLSRQSIDSLQLKSTNQATVFGLGNVQLTDTYLSPMKYSGGSLMILHERIKPTSWLDNKLILQHQFELQIAAAKNPRGSASEYFGKVSYNLGALHPMLYNNTFRAWAGADWKSFLGGLYNARNTNNPGSVKAYSNIQLTAMALYQWKIFTFRWQLTTPIFGILFSPDYGHSYYEMFSLGNKKGILNFASLHNQQALTNYLTVDCPVKNITFRLAYRGDYYTSKVNNLVTKISSHHLTVGVAVESINFGGQKTRKQPWLQSLYY